MGHLMALLMYIKCKFVSVRNWARANAPVHTKNDETQETHLFIFLRKDSLAISFFLTQEI